MPQTFDTDTPNPWTLNECPYTFAGNHAARMLAATSDADKGHLPVGGGMLDQTQVFVAASRLIRRERAAYQSKHHG